MGHTSASFGGLVFIQQPYLWPADIGEKFCKLVKVVRHFHQLAMSSQDYNVHGSKSTTHQTERFEQNIDYLSLHRLCTVSE